MVDLKHSGRSPRVDVGTSGAGDSIADLISGDLISENAMSEDLMSDDLELPSAMILILDVGYRVEKLVVNKHQQTTGA